MRDRLNEMSKLITVIESRVHLSQRPLVTSQFPVLLKFGAHLIRSPSRRLTRRANRTISLETSGKNCFFSFFSFSLFSIASLGRWNVPLKILPERGKARGLFSRYKLQRVCAELPSLITYHYYTGSLALQGVSTIKRRRKSSFPDKRLWAL